MQCEELQITEDGAVATLTINRPEKGNSLNPGLILTLADAVRRLAGENLARVLILTGTGGKAFCAGFDVSQIPASAEASAGVEGMKMLEDAFAAIRRCPLPTIAMINGHAMGAGLDLAVNCDFRICHDRAKFCIPPARLGLVYHYDGIRRLMDLVGLNRARYLLLTGRTVDCAAAEKMGLVDFVCSPEELEPFTHSLAEEIALDCAPLAVQGMKYVISALNGQAALSPEEEDQAVQRMEKAFQSKDLAEGLQAFLEKRKPRFRGE